MTNDKAQSSKHIKFPKKNLIVIPIGMEIKHLFHRVIEYKSDILLRSTVRVHIVSNTFDRIVSERRKFKIIKMKTTVATFVLCAIIAFVHSTPIPQNIVPAAEAAAVEAAQIAAAVPAAIPAAVQSAFPGAVPVAVPTAVPAAVAPSVPVVLPQTPVVPMVPTTIKPTGLFGSFLNAAQSFVSTGISAAQKVPSTFASGVESIIGRPIQSVGK